MRELYREGREESENLSLCIEYKVFSVFKVGFREYQNYRMFRKEKHIISGDRLSINPVKTLLTMMLKLHINFCRRFVLRSFYNTMSLLVDHPKTIIDRGPNLR